MNRLILTTYKTTQRIPIDQPLACQCYANTNTKFGEAVDFYKGQCIAGYTVELNGALWAGLIPPANSVIEELPTVPCLIPTNSSMLIHDAVSAWIEAARQDQLQRVGATDDPDANPVDVVPYDGIIVPGGGAPVTCYANYSVSDLVDFNHNGEFSIDLCLRSFCQGNLQSSWYLSDVNYPCVENRQGPLCGQCKPGLSQTLTSTVSNRGMNGWMNTCDG